MEFNRLLTRPQPSPDDFHLLDRPNIARPANRVLEIADRILDILLITSILFGSPFPERALTGPE